MDPIHPIVPTAQNIPVVAPAVGITPADRQIERHRQEEERERRRRKPRQDSYDDQESSPSDDDAGPDDGHPHIDVTV
jgi:hypothetical protein